MSAIEILIVVCVAITMAITIGKEAVISFGMAISNTLELSNSVENSTSFASATSIASSKRQESFLPFDGSRQTQQISEKKRATQLFEVNNWFYFTATMTFGALLYWKASFLFLRGYYSRKRPQAPSQITIAQLIVLLATHGSQAPFRSFDGNSTEIPRPAPSIPLPREPPDKGTWRH